jgi:hypothetical protein
VKGFYASQPPFYGWCFTDENLQTVDWVTKYGPGRLGTVVSFPLNAANESASFVDFALTLSLPFSCECECERNVNPFAEYREPGPTSSTSPIG